METTAGLIATYDSHDQAEDAVRELNRAGFRMTQLSIVGKGYRSEERPVGFYTVGDRMKSWGGVGAFWGALWGMLFGAAFFWIPGIGPLGVAGPFTQVLVGALEGAVFVGGVSVLGAALVNIGVPRDAIVKYERSVRADSYLLIVHGTDRDIEQARTVVERTRPSDVAAFGTSSDEVSTPEPAAS